MDSTVTLDAETRAALQRRTLAVLTVGQVIGAAALASSVTVGAFVIQSILGQETPWAGVATATSTTGTAVMSQMLARRMRRQGRRPGLQLGYGLAAVGGVAAGFGAQTGSLALFLVGLFVFGNGQASNLLARYAATDLAEPDQRGRAMSRIVFASTFGAVFGPLLIGPAQHVGQNWFGLEKYTGPWWFSSFFFLVAMVNTAARLRPDPLVVTGGTTRDGNVVAKIRAREALALIMSFPRARLALAAMVISQGAMVGVMAMTPVHLKLHGHEAVSQYVVSTHIAGMYAFSPLVGRYCDKKGRLPAILLGSAILMASTVLAALSGDVEQLLFPSLWGLGLGWNFGLIGGSSLLVDSIPTEHKVGVQGTADLLMSFCGGMAGFSSGFIRKAVGYHTLATLATLSAGVLLVAAWTAYRREAGGQPKAPASATAAT